VNKSEDAILLLAEPHTTQIPVFDHTPDIRLVVTDMDGTLLNDEKRLHDDFWPLVEQLRGRGILFSPASGRQYYTLEREFADLAQEMVFIAENGSIVMRGGHEISSDCLIRDDALRVVHTLRAAAADGIDGGIIVCGKQSAYIERSDPAFFDQVDRYYARLQIVDDLTNVIDDDVLKVAVYDFGSAEHGTLPYLKEFAGSHKVVVSSEHWLDVNTRTANKGRAVTALQNALGIAPAQTMVFGDFLNDLEMMDTADYAFAMHNAHPLLHERAKFVAPSNNENGVVRTIASVLNIELD
jgi:Cof subfamily protein (haloacid dehalogenase superfamily)